VIAVAVDSNCRGREVRDVLVRLRFDLMFECGELCAGRCDVVGLVVRLRKHEPAQ